MGPIVAVLKILWFCDTTLHAITYLVIVVAVCSVDAATIVRGAHRQSGGGGEGGVKRKKDNDRRNLLEKC